MQNISYLFKIFLGWCLYLGRLIRSWYSCFFTMNCLKLKSWINLELNVKVYFFLRLLISLFGRNILLYSSWLHISACELSFIEFSFCICCKSWFSSGCSEALLNKNKIFFIIIKNKSLQIENMKSDDRKFNFSFFINIGFYLSVQIFEF